MVLQAGLYPPNKYIQVPAPLVSVNLTLFGNMVFADIMKLGWYRISCTLTQ